MTYSFVSSKFEIVCSLAMRAAVVDPAGLNANWSSNVSGLGGEIIIIIIIIMNFYSPVSNTRCHSIGHKMRIARIKIRVDSPGRWERA